MTSPFDAVVFAGGGNRCLWQAGFLEVVAPEIGLRPERCSGSSAGATVACLVYSGTARAALEHFREATGANKKNAYPMNAFKKAPVFPHYAMYRRLIVDIVGAAGFQRLRDEGPEIRVQLTRMPAWLGSRARAGVLLGLMAYSVEKVIASPVHPRAGHKVGFQSEVASIRDCPDVEALADLLLGSSCVPPFTPVLTYGGRTVLDGGVVENVPVAALEHDSKAILVLLTRPYPDARLPKAPGRTYAMPSKKIPISKFDYTNPAGLLVAYELGLADGQTFLARWREGRIVLPTT